MKFALKLNDAFIEEACGRTALTKGAAYVRDGKVRIIGTHASGSGFLARVEDDGVMEVKLAFRAGGGMDARCTCSLGFSFDKYCRHTAAVLLYLNRHEDLLADPAQASPGDVSGHQDTQLAGTLIELFRTKQPKEARSGSYFETRSVLDTEFVIRVFTYGTRRWLGIEMKAGPKKNYIVKNIRSFLAAVYSGEGYPLSARFNYDPDLHCFSQKDEALIRRLDELPEAALAAGGSKPPPFRSQDGKLISDRHLLIGPKEWEALKPLIAKGDAVLLEQQDGTCLPLVFGDGTPPLQFELDENSEGGGRFFFHATHFETLTVLEDYRIALAEGAIWTLTGVQTERLAALIRLLDRSEGGRLPIDSAQMEPFMHTVVPGLKQLGQVIVSPMVSRQMVQAPLSAKLYLDRLKDRLVAGLEFHYGELVINPLEDGEAARKRNTIVIRNGEQENAILDLLEKSRLTKTEAGYYLDEEEDEYEFLRYTVPLLEKLVTVYATSAVKVRLYKSYAPPKVTVRLDDRTEWLQVRFDIDGIPESEIRKVLQALEEKRRFYRMPGGALMPLEDSEFSDIVELANRLTIHPGMMDGAELSLPAVRGLRLLDWDKDGRTVRLEKPLRLLLEHLRNPDHLDFPVPSGLESVLRDYQKYGYQWMKTLARYRFGGILADDMGLGKTVQSIAFILSEISNIRSSGHPALVVAPSSLMYNWLAEIEKFAPELKAIVVDGIKQDRKQLLKSLTGLGQHEKGERRTATADIQTAKLDVVITSYPLLRMDIAEYAAQAFHTVIYDEAQFFKNDTTLTAKAVKAIRADYRFALTGTPVENRLDDLWSIYDTVFPDLLPGKKEFADLTGEAVATRIRPFLLRRLKTDVLTELPEKIETTQSSELLPEQKKLYAAYLAKLRHESLKHLNEKGFHNSRIRILAGLTRLRQLCCHPALFVEGYDGDSAKLRQLLEMVEESRASGRRMLIFSQFTEMLGMIGRELTDSDFPFFYLDGSTPPAERLSLCSRFNDGERDLFLISLKAGGTGLNLTGADTVILYDLWWNPAVEQQAADRAHRIGQKKTVQVIRLVARGTVEEKVIELQNKKKHLIDEVIHAGEEGLGMLSEQDIREILML